MILSSCAVRIHDKHTNLITAQIALFSSAGSRKCSSNLVNFVVLLCFNLGAPVNLCKMK